MSELIYQVSLNLRYIVFSRYSLSVARSLPQFNLAASLFMVPKLMVNLQSLASQHLYNVVISWPGALFSQGKLTKGSHPFL